MYEDSKSNSAKHLSIYLNGNTPKNGYVSVLQALWSPSSPSSQALGPARLCEGVT